MPTCRFPEPWTIEPIPVASSGVLDDKGHEPLRLGGGEVDMVGDPFLASDADGEPAGAGAEFELALGQRAQRVGSS